MIGSAWAHTGDEHVTPWGAWTLDPLVLVPLGIAALLYARGSSRPRRVAGSRRGLDWPEGCFAAGMAALFIGLVSPLDALGEQLFSAHMLQHLVLMNIAAPLLVLGAPLPAMFRALPDGARRALGSVLKRKAWRVCWGVPGGLTFAMLLQQIVLWTWHTPAGIAAALESEGVHIAMHASLLAPALLFWRAVLHPHPDRAWGPVAALVVTLKTTGLVCIVLSLQPDTIYTAYGASASTFGLSAAEDEQLGWGLMMIVGSASYLAAAIALSALALARLEKRFPGNAIALELETSADRRDSKPASSFRNPQAHSGTQIRMYRKTPPP